MGISDFNDLVQNEERSVFIHRNRNDTARRLRLPFGRENSHC
jgi:hypothetical protein